MAEKKVTPTNAEQDKDKVKEKAKKAAAETDVTAKKETRKTGGHMRWSDRNLKEHVVPVAW